MDLVDQGNSIVVECASEIGAKGERISVLERFWTAFGWQGCVNRSFNDEKGGRQWC